MDSGLCFYKIISNSQKMDLPLVTVPQLQGVLGRRVTLRNADKKTWSVGVDSGGYGYSFTEGWPKFYQENSLEPNYKCKDLFHVKVFGLNACEKRGVGRPEIRVEEEAEKMEEFTVMEEEEDDDDDDDDDDNDDDDDDYVIEKLEPEETVGISKKKSKSHRFNTDLSSNHASPIGRFEEHETDIEYEEDDEEEARTLTKAKSRSPSSTPIQRVKEEVIEIEDDEDEDEEDEESTERDEDDEIEEEEETSNESKAKHKRKHSRPSSSSAHKKHNLRDYYGHDIFSSGLATRPKNPYFVSRPGRPRNNELYIPNDVILSLNLNIPSKFLLVDKNGRKWEAEIKKWKDGRAWCTSGWKRMCRANKISEDDTCICEFVREGHFGLSMLVRVVDADADASK